MFSFVKAFQNFWHTIISDAQKEIVDYVTPALVYIEKNGGKVVLSLAETLLSGAVAGTPWGALIAQLIAEAEKSGISLAEGAASVVLNYAQSNLIATGSTAPILTVAVPTAPTA